MPSDPAPGTFEERRLALDELKEQHDYDLRKREIELKRSDSGWLARLFTPLTTTILAGIVTVAGSVVGTLMQGRSTLDLERQKEQSELILKMVGVPDQKQARTNLDFLADSGLLDENVADRLRKTKTTPVIPPPETLTPSNSKAFEAVRNNDDAIDLVVAWEGGFTPGSSPDEAANAGITLKDLSAFLGRAATIDDLKNLPLSTIRDFYRPRLEPAAGIKVPMVRAAFLNLAVWTGPLNAMRSFQNAAGDVLGTQLVVDGILGPASIELINSVPNSEKFVETVNCSVLGHLKQTSAWQTFGPNWLKRLRAFSPVTLIGLCPELQAIPADASGSATSAAFSRP